MKTGFFLKTAWTNIKNNYRFFIPRILSEIGLLAVYYIVYTLKSDERITELRGGYYIAFCMSIGLVVMSLLSLILMLYTNSFLMKQRKREFGLYNVLGMEKRHVTRVLFHETAISSSLALLGGLALGMMFYKLSSLLICRLLKADIILGFDFLQIDSVLVSALFFVVIDLFTYLINCVGIAKMKPVELLASRATGEREPKVKWLIFLLGLIALGGGYYISLTTESPLEALLLFLIAVILVIIGTYFLFTAGSIFVLKVLKKNKKYYYDKKHMPAVSGLLYRMKQNAVGLASIAILATGVLVMTSTTVSLYAGMEQTLAENYPHHLLFEAALYDEDDEMISLPIDELSSLITDAAAASGATVKYTGATQSLDVAYTVDGKNFALNEDSDFSLYLGESVCLTLITNDEYARLMGEKLDLADDEIAMVALSTNIGNFTYSRDDIVLDGMPFSVRHLTYFPVEAEMKSEMDCYGVVLPSEEVLDKLYEHQKEVYAFNASPYRVSLAVDFEDVDAAQKATVPMQEYIGDYLDARATYGSFVRFDSVWHTRENYLGIAGSLLFLGIILGGVCLFATALIIYYKQISEGYDDRDRYQIMKKVGMSDEEIKSTIRTQTLYVFFLPLLVAGVHLLFAFPILNKMLRVLMLTNTELFITFSFLSFGVFALVYILIYLATAKTYYKIVH